MKRILRIGSVIGVIGVTAWIIYSLVSSSGESFLVFPKIELFGFAKYEPAISEPKSAEGFAKDESPAYPKVESLNYPKVESEDYPKVESLGYPKVESGDPNCDPFNGMELSLMTLSVREDIMVFPVYLKTEGEVIPGLVPLDEAHPVEYYALLSNSQINGKSQIKSNSCGLQGFDDRLYCMFTVTPEMLGSVVDILFFKDDCEGPSFTQLNQFIPELNTAGDGGEGDGGDGDGGEGDAQCRKDMGPADCAAAGGTMSNDLTTGPFCVCP